jgi:hypothetical protein
MDRAPVKDVQTISDGEEATLGKAGALVYSCLRPDHRNSQTPTAVVHGQEWFEEEVTIPTEGPFVRRP